MTPKTTG
uniref:Uncharacterized protein n=1 Tax=Romanomermis culicivorax TaxID=13658 RepID=A0A915KNG6_ROMCU